jgi:hypothetical protein
LWRRQAGGSDQLSVVSYQFKGRNGPAGDSGNLPFELVTDN